MCKYIWFPAALSVFFPVHQDIIALAVQCAGGTIAAAVAETSVDFVSQANLVRVAPQFCKSSNKLNVRRGMAGCSHCSWRHRLPARYVWNIFVVSEVVTYMQPVAIIMYCVLAAEFLARYTWDLPIRRSAPVPNKVLRGTMDNRLNRMLQAMLIMTIFIMIRYSTLVCCFCMRPHLDVFVGRSTE
jgi:hypothetical protein